MRASRSEVRTDKALTVRSMVFAVGIPRLQAGEDVNADQTHWGPNDLLHMAVDRMEDRVAAGIAAAIRARDKKESGSERI